MKYLKKIFENNKVVNTNILGDILLEITDLGYLSNIKSLWWSDDRQSSIVLTLYGKDGYIYPDEIIDAVERLVDFLDGEGYTLFDEANQKKLEIIKNRPTEKIRHNDFRFDPNILQVVDRYNTVNMKWDEATNQYIVTSSIVLEFRN